ncbi:MAG: metallophosphoesterase [Haloferacaceae archaeon]
MQDATFRDRAVYLADPDALVLADLHVGRAASSSVDFPLGERDDLVDRLEVLLAHFSPGTVVFAGDVLHDFGSATPEADLVVDALVGTVRDAGAEPFLIAGNHDPMLASVWDGDLHDAVRLDDGTVVCHGHEEPAERGHRYVFGHDHPTIDVEGSRHPCFLWAPAAYRGGDVLMLPSFTRLAAGVEVNGMTAANFHSPLITDADVLHPIVYDAQSQETLEFPPLGRFRSML